MRAVMLSGDSPHTAEAIAAERGMEEYEGENSPPAKAERGLATSTQFAIARLIG